MKGVLSSSVAGSLSLLHADSWAPTGTLIYVAGSVGLHNLLLQQVLQMALIQGTGGIFIYSPKPHSTLPHTELQGADHHGPQAA